MGEEENFLPPILNPRPSRKAFKHPFELPHIAGNFCFNHYERFS
jgi:hypothetical protein